MDPTSASNPLVRWYIDTRTLTASTTSLPLIETLEPADQEAIKKFYHLKDKHMSLASQLLKYLFIHRTCQIPWAKIHISRTPSPHRRPCFIPSAALLSSKKTPIPSIEFNVSHQASMVALAGTILPPPSSSPDTNPNSNSISTPNPNPSSAPLPTIPQIGIDITCVNERRGSKDPAPQTRQSLNDFVDIFAEVFSARELHSIKTQLPPASNNESGFGNASSRSEEEIVAYGFRLFYTYWALKEAYIKMTGEALLAPWLRELEFVDVVAPEPGAGAESVWGTPYRGVRTLLYGKEVQDVRVEVVALERDYLVATAARGGGIGSASAAAAAVVGGGEDPWLPLKRIDIGDDVEECARGRCACLG